MLLRSSSTPVLSSLLPSFYESPSNNTHHETNATIKHHLQSSAAIHQSHNKLSFGSFNLPTVSCNSSPISPLIAGFSGNIRRAQSEGNLEGLAYASCKHEEEFRNTSQPSNKKLPGTNNKCLTLETIPSFSYSSLRGRREDEEDESDIEDYEEETEEYLDENDEELVEINGRDAKCCLKKEKMSMVVTEEMKALDKICCAVFEGESGLIGQEMYLAKGGGIGGIGGGGSGGNGGGSDGFNGSGGDSEDNHEVEEYYKRMVKENPGNPLFLRNYAQFLHQTKRDLHRAENYYSRAILADPGDGEVLAQYAKLIWELHRDEDTAAGYFERAVQASPQDSHVHAAYADFLWETEEDDDVCTATFDRGPITPTFHREAVASAKALS